RLIMVVNRLGTAIAMKRKPTRTAIVASTSRSSGASAGDASAAMAASRMPVGHRNQPDLPKSVRKPNSSMTEAGARFADSAIEASTKTMATAAQDAQAAPPAQGRRMGAGDPPRLDPRRTPERGKAAGDIVAGPAGPRGLRAAKTAGDAHRGAPDR